MGDEQFWRKLINSLDISDLEPEDIPVGEKDAEVLRLSFDMYLLSPTIESGKVFLVNANQKMEDLGTMTIKEALTMIKRRNNKKS